MIKKKLAQKKYKDTTRKIPKRSIKITKRCGEKKLPQSQWKLWLYIVFLQHLCSYSLSYTDSLNEIYFLLWWSNIIYYAIWWSTNEETQERDEDEVSWYKSDTKKKKGPNHHRNEDNIGRNTEGNKAVDKKEKAKTYIRRMVKIKRNRFLSIVWKW